MGGFAIHWLPNPVIVSVIPTRCKAEDLSRNISTCLLLEDGNGKGGNGQRIWGPGFQNTHPTGSQMLDRQHGPYTSAIPLHTSLFILKREIALLDCTLLMSFQMHPPKEGRNPLVQPDSQCVCKEG